MMMVELGRNSHHCCSGLQAVLVAAPGIVLPQIHAGPAPGMMLGELVLNSHRCLSFARQKSTHSYCFDSARWISLERHRQSSRDLPKSHGDLQKGS